jgi:hypothetical protein
MEAETGFWIFFIVMLAVFAVIYIAPSWIAFSRGHPNRWLILVINIVFGGTVLGWCVALVWALRAVHVDPLNSGGQSGLNLFVNDTKKIEVVPAVSLPVTHVSSELERLHGLLMKNAISQQEFNTLKATLLGG